MTESKLKFTCCCFAATVFVASLLTRHQTSFTIFCVFVGGACDLCVYLLQTWQFDEGSKCGPDSARAKALIRAANKMMEEYVHVDR